MPETLTSKSFTINETEDYGVRLEYNDQFAILHFSYVHKFTKGVFYSMQVYLENLWDFLSTVGYEAIYVGFDPNNLKIKKLVGKLGFKELGIAPTGELIMEYK